MQVAYLLLLSLGHLVTDIAQGAVPLLLPYLKASLDLSYTAVGIVVLSSNLSSSIIQPVFGYASDRYRLLWLLPVGCLLSAIGIAAIGWVPNYGLLLFVIWLSGLGVAGYHPEASKTAHFLSSHRKATAMAIFAVGGNLGFGLGPVLAGILYFYAGLKGTAGLLFPGAAMAVILFLLLPRIRNVLENENAKRAKALPNSPSSGQVDSPAQTGSLILLLIVVIMRSWVHVGLMTYIPLYFMEHLGVSEVYASTMLSVFLIAGAVGTLLGGPMADLLGPKTMINFSMGAMVPLIYLLFHSQGIWAIVFSALAGMILISTFGITTVFGQYLLPNSVGLASGLMLGFAIGTGGLGATLLGVVADNFGLPMTITIIGLLPAVGLVLSSLLPRISTSLSQPSHTNSQAG